MSNSVWDNGLGNLEATFVYTLQNPCQFLQFWKFVRNFG